MVNDSSALTGQFHWFIGVVEDIFDPAKMGRVRVRVFRIHGTKEEVPTETLPWASVVMGGISGSVGGVGWSVGLLQGSWVAGWFADGDSFQQPIILGAIPSYSGPPPENGMYPQEKGKTREDAIDEVDMDDVPMDEDFMKFLAQLEAQCPELPHGALYAIMMQESRGNPKAVSPVGAAGLFQLMPGTARDMGVTDVWDPYDNARGGAKYICIQMRKYKNFDHALAAYNWGPGNVNKWLRGEKNMPTETKNYISQDKGVYRFINQAPY